MEGQRRRPAASRTSTTSGVLCNQTGQHVASAGIHRMACWAGFIREPAAEPSAPLVIAYRHRVQQVGRGRHHRPRRVRSDFARWQFATTALCPPAGDGDVDGDFVSILSNAPAGPLHPGAGRVCQDGGFGGRVGGRVPWRRSFPGKVSSQCPAFFVPPLPPSNIRSEEQRTRPLLPAPNTYVCQPFRHFPIFLSSTPYPL